MSDKSIVRICTDCALCFVITPQMQQDYRSRGQELPVKCTGCRTSKAAKRRRHPIEDEIPAVEEQTIIEGVCESEEGVQPEDEGEPEAEQPTEERRRRPRRRDRRRSKPEAAVAQTEAPTEETSVEAVAEAEVVESVETVEPAPVEEIPPVPTHAIANTVYPCPDYLKNLLMLKLIEIAGGEGVMVFARTKHRADRVARQVQRGGYTTGMLHANRSQNQRQTTLDSFRGGRCQVLIATDNAIRNLSLDGIAHVINYDFPCSPELYVNRTRRTASAETDDVKTIVTDRDAAALAQVEETLAAQIERVMVEGFDYDAPPRTPGGGPQDSQKGAEDSEEPAPTCEDAALEAASEDEAQPAQDELPDPFAIPDEAEELQPESVVVEAVEVAPEPEPIVAEAVEAEQSTEPMSEPASEPAQAISQEPVEPQVVEVAPEIAPEPEPEAAPAPVEAEVPAEAPPAKPARRRAPRRKPAAKKTESAPAESPQTENSPVEDADPAK